MRWPVVIILYTILLLLFLYITVYILHILRWGRKLMGKMVIDIQIT